MRYGRLWEIYAAASVPENAPITSNTTAISSQRENALAGYSKPQVGWDIRSYILYRGRRNECLEPIRQTYASACWWRLKPVSQPTRLQTSSWLAVHRCIAG